MGSSRIARIEQDLASMSVSPPEVGATQMTGAQYPQQAKVRRSVDQGTVAGALGGASQQEETEESHVLAESDGEDMAVSDMAWEPGLHRSNEHWGLNLISHLSTKDDIL
jgi:hypothetical protein